MIIKCTFSHIRGLVTHHFRRQSFEQLYHSWKRSERRYFYLCAPKFTVIFFKTALPIMDGDETCWSVNGAPRLHAIITPTSRGMREIFNKEYIEFERPLRNKRRSSRESKLILPNENSVSLMESLSAFNVTQSQPPFIEG